MIEFEETLSSKYEITNARIRVITPDLFFSVETEEYGEIDVKVSEKVYDCYEPGDKITLSVCEGALGLTHCYVEELGYSPFYRAYIDE